MHHRQESGEPLGDWVARVDQNDEVERLLRVIDTTKAQLRSILAHRERQLRYVARMSGTGGWTLLLNPLRLIPSVEWIALHGFEIGSRPSVRRLLRLIERPERLKLYSAIRHCARQGGGVDVRIRSRHVTGRVLWMRMLAERVEDESGRLVSLEGACQDVTEQVTREHHLAASRESLEITVRQLVEQRTSDLRTFSYALAHDLRAPLTTIGGYAQVLSEKHAAQLDEEGVRRLSRIVQSAHRAEALIEAILMHVSSLERPIDRARVSLDRLAHETIEQLRSRNPERLVTVRIDPDLLVMGDPALLGSVVGNLLSNAWKFTSRRGDDAEINFGRAGKDTFFVKDNGAGFAVDKLQLFRPLKRFHTDAEFPGVGIGLATAFRIVQRHGGKLWVDSTPGAGTTIWFTLPVPQD